MLKIESKIFVIEKTFNRLGIDSTEVDLSTHNLKVKGSNLAAANGREKWQKFRGEGKS
jgi:hypothetical protein